MWSCGRPSCHCALTGDYLSYAESRVVTISRSYLNQIYSFYVGICCFSLEFISERRLLFLSLWDRFYYPLQLSCSPWLSELGLAKALLLSSLCDCVGCSCRPLCVYRESQQCVYRESPSDFLPERLCAYSLTSHVLIFTISTFSMPSLLALIIYSLI